MAIVLGETRFSTNDLVQISRYNGIVELHSDAIVRIKICREMLEDKIQSVEIMYGVNTGIGEFSEVVLDNKKIKDFQKYLIYNPNKIIIPPTNSENAAIKPQNAGKKCIPIEPIP